MKYRILRKKKKLIKLACISICLIYILIQFLSIFSSATNTNITTHLGSGIAVPGDDYMRGWNLYDSYDPTSPTDVAFAIPVCCSDFRLANIQRMVNTLKSQGVEGRDIYVFDDNKSRKQGSSVETNGIKTFCDKEGVTIYKSGIVRTEGQEGPDSFGRYLARHYHFMADTLFIGNHGAGYGSETVVNNIRKTYEHVVFLEDDLLLSDDAVKYFWEMSRIMKIDESLYCASAHVDNAFFATSYNVRGQASNDHIMSVLDPNYEAKNADINYLNPSEFHFRRGNHFMAPGWMTSKEIYLNVVRPSWLDEENGVYAYSKELHLLNGHWDRFFDSRIGKRDCIYPEVPRILHVGAGGFTVGKRAQLELYEGLRLSSVKSTASYGDLNYLTAWGYKESIVDYLNNAIEIIVPEQLVGDVRGMHFKLRVSAKNDQDPQWNILLNRYFGLIGVGGYGGYEGYVKLRGVHNGAVFVRWMTNLVLLVGEYSPYYDIFDNTGYNSHPLVSKIPNTIQVGCFQFNKPKDVLSVIVPWYSSETVTPTLCLASCLQLHYPFAAVKHGECRCSNSNHINIANKKDDILCRNKCTSSHSSDPVDSKCGGIIAYSIYSDRSLDTAVTSPEEPLDVKYEIGEIGESCDTTCNNINTQCREELSPLVSNRCDMIEYVTYKKCNSCMVADIIIPYAPYVTENDNVMQCMTQMPPRISCSAKPKGNIRRICVCGEVY